MPENEFDIQEKETKQYISVKIGEEKFGIDIGYVDNIVRMQKITRVPKAQKYFKGIINLRSLRATQPPDSRCSSSCFPYSSGTLLPHLLCRFCCRRACICRGH